MKYACFYKAGYIAAPASPSSVSAFGSAFPMDKMEKKKKKNSKHLLTAARGILTICVDADVYFISLGEE